MESCHRLLSAILKRHPGKSADGTLIRWSWVQRLQPSHSERTKVEFAHLLLQNPIHLVQQHGFLRTQRVWRDRDAGSWFGLEHGQESGIHRAKVMQC